MSFANFNFFFSTKNCLLCERNVCCPLCSFVTLLLPWLGILDNKVEEAAFKEKIAAKWPFNSKQRFYFFGQKNKVQFLSHEMWCNCSFKKVKNFLLYMTLIWIQLWNVKLSLRKICENWIAAFHHHRCIRTSQTCVYFGWVQYWNSIWSVNTERGPALNI